MKSKTIEIQHLGCELTLFERLINDNYKLMVTDYSGSAVIELRPEHLKQINKFFKECEKERKNVPKTNT